MDIKKTIAVLLTVPLMAGVFTGCRGKKIKIEKEQGQTETRDLVHPEDVKDPSLLHIYYITSMENGMEYDPPVAGNEIYVGLSVDPEHEDELSGMKMYIFEDSAEGWVDPENALLSAGGEMQEGGVEFIIFHGLLPQEMKTGDYKFVFVRGDGTVDSYFTRQIVATSGESSGYLPVDKPVIYLYPQEETEVYVNLDFEGDLTCTYPVYNEAFGWHVTARPDGRITDLTGGRDYDYLFWEGMSEVPGSFDRAVCVRGCDTVQFLEEYLEAAGLNYSEIDDFVSFWLPKMENNEYNLISFPMEEYEEMAQLNVSPAPDTMIRVYMVFTALDQEVQIDPGHQLAMPQTPERNGFTVVEWGGSEI